MSLASCCAAGETSMWDERSDSFPMCGSLSRRDRASLSSSKGSSIRTSFAVMTACVATEKTMLPGRTKICALLAT